MSNQARMGRPDRCAACVQGERLHTCTDVEALELSAVDLVNETMTRARELDPDELNKFHSMLGATSIACLRGIHGDQFVTDYLTAALNDQDKMVLTPSSPH